METTLRIWMAWQSSWARWRQRLAHQAGEGVISTAIAVLIMALIGAAMWLAFNEVFEGASEDIKSNVEQIQ